MHPDLELEMTESEGGNSESDNAMAPDGCDTQFLDDDIAITAIPAIESASTSDRDGKSDQSTRFCNLSSLRFTLSAQPEPNKWTHNLSL
jgi:hypothetical protein